MTPLTLGVFGALQITLPNGSTAKFESDKSRALLAYLAVESARPHRRDALVGLFWPDESEQTARQNFRQALYNLRQSINDASAHPPYLHITRDEIQFNTASKFTLDVASFNAHLAATANHSHSRMDECAVCAPRLQQAVDLYRGKFLQEFFLEDSAEFEEWALARREELHQHALEALNDLANYYEHNGDLSAARRCAMRQLELDPWSEQAHRQLMRVFAFEGQIGSAIAQYEACHRVLADEMGVEPSSETRELYEKIKSGNWKLEVRNWKLEVGKTLQPPTSNLQLPTHLTPFIGREQELADLERLIADPSCRMITLIGPGGMGKTRLAAQAASNQRSAFTQGVALVPLVTVNSIDAIVPAIAEALGFTFYGSTNPRTQLFNYLRDKQMLLVLDNVEQLLNAADLFVEMLQRTIELKLLLTSREPLNVQGEWVFPVEGLEIPGDDQSEAIELSSAVALFVQRAQRARVGFTLSEQDRPGLTRLCRLVGGTPLALELAATWVRTLSVTEIVHEIERDLNFLSATVRDLPERHRSIRAVFDHSWEMIAVEEQRVLCALAAFRGRFRREAAEQVAGASLTTLSTLVAKSLVRRTSTGHYDLHELVRQYAASKLSVDEWTSVGERHSRYYLDWLGRNTARLMGNRQKETAAELATQVDNLRAAWDWAIEHRDFTRVRQASIALWYLCELRAWFEDGEKIFRNAADQLAKSSNDDALITANAMRAHGAYFTFRQGNVAPAYDGLFSIAARLRSGADALAKMYAVWYLGLVSWHLGKLEQAQECFETSVAQARTMNERWYEAMISQFIGIIAMNRGEYDAANHHLAEALAKAREIDDPTLTSHILGFLGQCVLALGKPAEAEKILRESLSITQEIGFRHGIGNAFDGLGLVVQMSNPQEARTLFASSCAMYREIGDLQSLSRALTHQGNNSLALNDFADAQNSFVEVMRLTREGGYVPFALDALLGLAVIDSKNSNDERALEFVACVLEHPATTHDTKARAEKLRTEIEARLTPQRITGARVQTSFDQVVARVLGQFDKT